jgi:F-type H+-transporting ATPase subunit c
MGVTSVPKKLLLILIVILFVGIVQPAMAQGNATTTDARNINQWIAIACAFGLGLASAVCGIAQSIAIRGAVDGIARNPGAADNIRGALIIGLALIESLVIYVLLIAFMLYFKWA